MSNDFSLDGPGDAGFDAEDDLDPSSERMVKVATTVAALAAGFVAHRALQAGWKLVTGKPAPGADDDEVSLGEVLVFTALSAAAVGVIRVWATRGARKIAHKTIQHQGSAVS